MHRLHAVGGPAGGHLLAAAGDDFVEGIQIEGGTQLLNLLFQLQAALLEALHIGHVLGLFLTGLLHQVIDDVVALAAQLFQLLKLALGVVQLAGEHAAAVVEHLPHIGADGVEG